MTSVDSHADAADRPRSGDGEVASGVAAGDRSRFQNLVELLKPKIALTVGFTVAAGYLLAVASNESLSFSWWRFVNTLVGVTLVAFASAVLNQAWEHRTDAAMSRTAGRPIPTGRVSVAEAMLVGMLLGPWSAGYLALVINPLTGGLTALTCILYVFAYTPLKRVSAWATFVGAIPGAMPPLLGWTAATNGFGEGGIVLFVILFLWQFPHFIAIAWKYREQYDRAGLFMLPADDVTGRKAGVVAFLTAAVLLVTPFFLSRTFGVIPLSFSLTILTGLGLGFWYLYVSGRFLTERSTKSAMRMLGVSFVYVLGVFAAVIVDALRGIFGGAG